MIDIGIPYSSPDEGGQYMVDRDVRDNEDGSETTIYVVYFRRYGIETWEYVNCWETRADAEAYMNGVCPQENQEVSKSKENEMGVYLFRFTVPDKDTDVTLRKGDGGTWIVGREVRGTWRSVCESELFDYAKHAFDAEVAKIENEIKYEIEGA